VIAAVQKTEVCATIYPHLDSDSAIDTASKIIETKTKASSFPSLLRQKRSAIQTVERSDMENSTVIQQACPECGRQEVRYTAVQLRSADEGSTIFYTCDCGHK
jgi:DNA-directed RNA polymerase I subunit RPA12